MMKPAARNNWTAWLCAFAFMIGLAGCRLPSAAQTNVKQAMEKKVQNDWEQFDPRADDLEIQTVSEKTQDGIKVTCLYFTSHKIDAKPVRIYGIYARPAQVKGRIPAILFIHGGGQGADESEVLGMARHGYACFSHDWKISELPEEATYMSKWPFDEHGKRLRSDEYHDSPAWIARRALTVLERQAEVDSSRMGVYGFSWGGYHTWTVAATDSRVKAANASCGVLWTAEPLMGNLRAPVLFTDASDDFFARLDAAQKVMEAVNVESRRLISPNENHNMASTGWEATRLKWFDHYLKGGPQLAPAPTLSVKTAKGGTKVTVKAPSATAGQLIYSYGSDAAVDRCWFGIPMRKTVWGDFSAALPRRDGVDIWYFANADYPDGTTLSTPYAVSKAPAASQAVTTQPGDVLYDPSVDGPYPWYFSWSGPVADHPWHHWGGTTLAVSDVAGRPALHVKSELAVLGVFKAFLRSPACPLRKGEGATKLSLEIIGERPLRVTVAAYSKGEWNAESNPFQATAELPSGQGWAVVEIPVQSFKCTDPATKREEIMPSFAGVRQFHLTVESADKTRHMPAIGRIKWLP
jgi:dienelactone hydrolase